MDAKGTALVTGASRGLGRAVAIELAQRGFDVVAGVRDVAAAQVDLLAAAAGAKGSLRVERLDVANLGDYAPPQDLRVLVNNAGFRGRYLPVEHADLDEWRRTFETNVFGVVDLTQRVIPILRQAGTGVICNIGSLGAYSPMPFYATYRASKMALAALTEGLCIELAPFGIRVIDIPIGGVETDMLKTSISRRPPEAIEYEAYRPMAERQVAMTQAAQSRVPSAQEVAVAVVDAILQDQGPLHRACDPTAAAMLPGIAASSDEQRLLAMMQHFGVAVK